MSGEHSIGDRKAQHLEICSDDAQYQVEGGTTGLDGVRFIHHSLPEVNEDEIRTEIDFLGSRVTLPLFISSMTGGSAKSYQVNKLLAEVAERVGIPVGMGSIRILFRKPEVIDHFRLKEHAPDVPIFANIGGVQLIDGDNTQLIDLVHELSVDGLAVHLNPGQELAQPEGDRACRGVLDTARLRGLLRGLGGLLFLDDLMTFLLHFFQRIGVELGGSATGQQSGQHACRDQVKRFHRQLPLHYRSDYSRDRSDPDPQLQPLGPRNRG